MEVDIDYSIVVVGGHRDVSFLDLDPSHIKTQKKHDACEMAQRVPDIEPFVVPRVGTSTGSTRSSEEETNDGLCLPPSQTLEKTR